MRPVNKWARFALPLLLVSAIAVACGDDEEAGPTGPTIADLAGSWDATSLKLTLNANPAVSVDLVQTFGGTVTLDVTSAGRYTFTGSVPGQPTLTVTGDITITGANTFTLTNDDDPTDVLSGTFTLSADKNSLSITLQDAELIDLTGDGVVDSADAALLEGAFTRV
jgi:hypothetical protein